MSDQAVWLFSQALVLSSRIRHKALMAPGHKLAHVQHTHSVVMLTASCDEQLDNQFLLVARHCQRGPQCCMSMTTFGLLCTPGSSFCKNRSTCYLSSQKDTCNLQILSDYRLYLPVWEDFNNRCRETNNRQKRGLLE